MRLLLVEDDEVLAQALSTALAQQNYLVDIAHDGEMGWDYAQVFTYDLILLDVTLPKLDGISLCQRLRDGDIATPILLLTARDNSADKIAGLDAGADDYVVKPCTVPELLARVRALLRRRQESSSSDLTWGDLCLKLASCEVTYQGRPLRLTPKEYAILELLLRNPRRVFSKSAILEHLWSFDDPPNEDTIRAHIKGLRRRFKAAQVPDFVDTVYGIGYRLKDLRAVEPAADAEASEATATAVATAVATRAAVAKLRQRFQQPILERLATLAATASALAAGDCPGALLQQAEQQAHKLVGSLGMFGLAPGSELAGRLEQLAIALQNHPTPKQSRAFCQQVQALDDLLQQAWGTVVEEPEPESAATSEPEFRLLALHCEPAFVARLQTVAAAENVHVTTLAAGLELTAAVLESHQPDIVLLDCTQAPTPAPGLALLAQLTTQQPPLPVLVVVAAASDLAVRLEIARLGGKGLLEPPLEPVLVLERAAEQLRRSRLGAITVLAVDDDPLILASLADSLQPWGIRVWGLTEPQQFWQVLAETQPQALILDIAMPGISGLELCQVVRQSTIWQKLPILILSAKRDRPTIQQLYQAGADDYIAKPVTTAELVTRLLNRLERTRLLRELAETEPRSGLANRLRSEQELERYLRLAQRYQQPLCFAVLELAGFKAINQSYGHASGDRVLQRFGQLLRQHFQSEDIVACWGGSEFVIGMYGATVAVGRERLAALTQALTQEAFLVEAPEPLYVTFAAGLAEYPHAGETVTQLYRAAAAALGSRAAP